MKHSIKSSTSPTLLSRRAFLGALGIGAPALMLGGCDSPQPPSSTRVPQKIQLVYQDWQTEWFPPLVREMLDIFHEEQPHIRVYYTPEADAEQTLLEDFESGIAPDVFAGCCTFFPIWAQEGFTLDLRSYAAEDLDEDIINDWNDAQYRAFFLEDGRQYGLPKYHGALALYFNKDLFDQYQVTYPDASWDHDDYLDAMRRLTHDRDGDGQTDLWGSMLDVSWDRIQMHVNGWGGHLVDPTNRTHCAMAEPEALAALEWLRARMWDDHVMASFLDVNNLTTRRAFIEQKVAMVEDGSWSLRDILDEAQFRIGVAPFPAGPARRATLATTDGWGIFADTPHPEAAWTFLKFLTSKTYGRAMAKQAFLQPARASLVGEWANFIRDAYPQQAKDVELAAFADGHMNGYAVTAEIFEQMAEAKSISYEAWDSILTLGQTAVEPRILAVCEQINALGR